MAPHERKTILALENEPHHFAEFYGALSAIGELHVYPTLDGLLAEERQFANPLYLLDTQLMQEAPTALVAQLVDRRLQVPMGLVTVKGCEQYLLDLRRWGILQVAVKAAPTAVDEVELFLNTVANPASAFGLSSHITDTMEIFNLSVQNIRQKNEAIERVINHFATANFDVHKLYDVRLILEETLNNAFFHAFRSPGGEEKYSLLTFLGLGSEEKINIEYGNNAQMAGFTVTDSAGTLSIKTVLSKIERQQNREGLLDSSGRGLYLSRMLSSSFIINIEENRRTQIIALFDERRHLERTKPFQLNYVGRDSFSEWRLDPEFD